MTFRNARSIRQLLLLLIGLLLTLPRAEASLFGSNTIEDIFTVKKIENGEATLEGTPKTLKAGDKLYFVRSPFQFSVKSVKVIITLPSAADLEVGNTLMRKPNDQIKNGIRGEQQLKSTEEY
jgi:hypothetical protein